MSADWLANLFWVTALHIFRHRGYLSDSSNLIRLKFCTISWASVHKSEPSEARGGGGGRGAQSYILRLRGGLWLIFDEYFKIAKIGFNTKFFVPK